MKNMSNCNKSVGWTMSNIISEFEIMLVLVIEFSFDMVKPTGFQHKFICLHWDTI